MSCKDLDPPTLISIRRLTFSLLTITSFPSFPAFSSAVVNEVMLPSLPKNNFSSRSNGKRHHFSLVSVVGSNGAFDINTLLSSAQLLRGAHNGERRKLHQTSFRRRNQQLQQLNISLLWTQNRPRWSNHASIMRYRAQVRSTMSFQAQT